MPDLNFQIDSAAAEPYAASPLLLFKLRITNADPSEAIQNIVLRCQIQIEATRRRYDSVEQGRLFELFGEPNRWSQTLRGFLWTHASTVVPPFAGNTVVDLPVPCTFDFNVAATKYFSGLEDGDVPLLLLFSGTVFHAPDGGGLQIAQIPWEKEARYRLPVRAWKEMMDLYYPNSAWLRLRRDVHDRLFQYKMRRGLTTWEETLDSLLDSVEENVPP